MRYKFIIALLYSLPGGIKVIKYSIKFNTQKTYTSYIIATYIEPTY